MLEISSINTLTITGLLGAEDFITLRGATGKLATVQTLDISNVTIVPDESTCYANLYGGFSGLTNQYFYYQYYISDNPRTEINKGETGLGVGTVIYEIYNNDLSALFNGTKAYRKIILPRLESIGQSLVSANDCVEEVIMQEGARYIGASAFANASSLTRITVPASVDSIGAGAFRNTSAEIQISSPLRAIADGAFRESKIPTLDFSSLEYLGKEAFYKSSLAGTVDLSNLKEIPEAAFRETQVTKAILSDNLSTIGEYAFYGSTLSDINIPTSPVFVGYRSLDNTPWYNANAKPDSQGIVYIGTTAYSANAKSSEITIKEGTTALSDNLFSSGKKLTKINLPSTITNIGNSSFYYQDILETIQWPDNLEVIGDEAFAYCKKLNFGAFPDRLVSIGKSSFLSCGTLTELTLPVSLTSVGYEAFSGNSQISIIRLNSRYAKWAYSRLEGLTHIIVGPEVEFLDCIASDKNKLRVVRFEDRDESTPLKIGDNAFLNCENLQECKLPAATTSIGKYAFSGCKNIDFGAFPAEVTHVGAGAFQYVETPCVIHDLKMDSIPEEAFLNFKGLTEITFAYPLRFLGYGCLAGTSISTFHLPASIMNADNVSYPFGAGSIYYPTLCDKLKNVTFEEGTYKFNISVAETALEHLEVPDGIKEFGTRVPATLKTLSLPAECLDFDRYMLNNNKTVHISWRGQDGLVYEGNPYEHYIPTYWYDLMRTGDWDLYLPEGIAMIEDYAFNYATLNQISLPSTLNYIARNAFYKFDALSLIEFRGATPPKTDNNERVRLGSTDAIIVPFGTREVYQSALEKSYEDKITERPGRLEVSLNPETIYIPVGTSADANIIINPDYVEIPINQIHWTCTDWSLIYGLPYPTYYKIFGKEPGECDVTVSFPFRDTTYSATVHVIVTGDSSLDSISIDSDDDVKIYNLAGILVYEGKYSGASLPSGFYIARCKGKTSKIRILK